MEEKEELEEKDKRRSWMRRRRGGVWQLSSITSAECALGYREPRTP